MKTKLFLFSLMAITIMSCKIGKKKDTDAAESYENAEMNIATTENTKWVITNLEDNDMTDGVENRQEIYFTLDSATKRISGKSGCNTFMGTYELNENKISFSQLGSTRMMCPDSKINESLILNIFVNANNFSNADGKFTIYNAENEALAEFKKAAMDTPIVEKYWKLIELEGKDISMADNQEREIFFTLKTQENRVTGFAGCNSISGEYALEEGNRIRFSNIATTLKMCPDVNFNESELLNVFNIADNYTIQNDILSLNVGKRAQLAVFEVVYMQ